MPPLFVLSADGSAELVNYRVQAGYILWSTGSSLWPSCVRVKPVKHTLTVSAEIAGLLEDYAAIYNQAYGGEAEPVEELIPYMLEMFLRSDRVFYEGTAGVVSV